MKKCDHCKDKETNYDCPCWYEGYLMGGSEAGYNKKELQKDIIKEINMRTPIFFTKEGQETLERDIKIRNQVRKEILERVVKLFESE